MLEAVRAADAALRGADERDDLADRGEVAEFGLHPQQRGRDRQAVRVDERERLADGLDLRRRHARPPHPDGVHARGHR